MSELLFVTVGTTAVGNPRIGDTHLNQIAQQYLKVPDERFAELHELEEKLVSAHSDFWREMKGKELVPDDFDRTSAELTSTMRLTQQQQSITGIILLGSETTEGKLATAVNHAVLSRIWKGGQVLKDIVPGLEKRFTKVTPAIERILKDRGAPSASRVHFNITGGFKGVIPSITYLAVQHPGWSVFYQYQGLNTATEVFFSVDGSAKAKIEEKERGDPVVSPEDVAG
jgi:CRISPR/Cas system-associated protein Csm6